MRLNPQTQQARAAAVRSLEDPANATGKVVIKAQVLVGGRGKAGGVRLAATADEAEDVAAHYGSVPEWAGLVLVDVKTGGILAAASYTAAKDGSRDRNGAFAPTQRLFPPGSVVKPLHVAMVLERGLLDWNETIDCRPGYLAGSDFVRPVPARRTIRDSHQNGPLPVSQVLIQSSNIGATRIGLRLGPDGHDEYLQRYGFGAPSGAELPGELVGTVPSQIASQSVNEQYVFAGPSVLFGYQIQATILQVARAYLDSAGQVMTFTLTQRYRNLGGGLWEWQWWWWWW